MVEIGDNPTMLNYEGASHQFYTPVYHQSGAEWSATPLLPTTSTDYVPQLVTANPYYASYNVPSTTSFPTYAPPLVQQFGAGYPPFAPNNDTCLNVYPPSNIKSDSSTIDAITRNYSMDSSLSNPTASTFTSKRNIKREPSNSPPVDMVCMWETDSSGGVCGRQFVDQRKFVDHLNNEHVGALDGIRHICLWRDCSRSLREFKAKYKLINHIRVHTGEKPFCCSDPQCKKRFARSENLKERSPLNVAFVRKRLPTPATGRSICMSIGIFYAIGMFVTKKDTFSKHKPYICQFCQKKYTHPSSLRKHHKQMHPDQPSICMSKNEEFEESSDSGNASITPVLSDQNTYAPNSMSHQQTLLANGALFQSQNNPSLIPSKDFQQRIDAFAYFPTTFTPQNAYYHQC